MEPEILKFEIRDFRIIRLDAKQITTKNQNYVHCQFIFTSDWTGLNKKAIFTKGVLEPLQIDLENDACAVPNAFMDEIGTIGVSVFAGERRTVTTAMVEVIEGGYQDGAEPPPPEINYSYITTPSGSVLQIKHEDGVFYGLVGGEWVAFGTGGEIGGVTIEEVQAAIDGHNTANDTHEDIRQLIAEIDIPTLTETDPVYTADKKFLALKTEIPTKLSELANDEEFTTIEPVGESDIIPDVSTVPVAVPFVTETGLLSWALQYFPIDNLPTAINIMGPGGLPGPTGRTGQTGADGKQGETGARGAQGLSGSVGVIFATFDTEQQLNAAFPLGPPTAGNYAVVAKMWLFAWDSLSLRWEQLGEIGVQGKQGEPGPRGAQGAPAPVIPATMLFARITNQVMAGRVEQIRFVVDSVNGIDYTENSATFLTDGVYMMATTGLYGGGVTNVHYVKNNLTPTPADPRQKFLDDATGNGTVMFPSSCTFEEFKAGDVVRFWLDASPGSNNINNSGQSNPRLAIWRLNQYAEPLPLPDDLVTMPDLIADNLKTVARDAQGEPQEQFNKFILDTFTSLNIGRTGEVQGYLTQREITNTMTAMSMFSTFGNLQGQIIGGAFHLPYRAWVTVTARLANFAQLANIRLALALTTGTILFENNVITDAERTGMFSPQVVFSGMLNEGAVIRIFCSSSVTQNAGNGLFTVKVEERLEV